MSWCLYGTGLIKIVMVQKSVYQWCYAHQPSFLCSQTLLHTTELNSAISLVPTQFKHPGPELSTSYSGVVSKYFVCGQTIKDLGVAERKNVEIGSTSRA